MKSYGKKKYMVYRTDNKTWNISEIVKFYRGFSGWESPSENHA